MNVGTSALLQYQNQAVAPPAAEKATKGHLNKKLLNACQEFEAVFIKQMLNSMRKTVPQNGLLDGGIGRNIYEDMLYQQYADKMAKTANLGLARLLYNQLSGQPVDRALPGGV